MKRLTLKQKLGRARRALAKARHDRDAAVAERRSNIADGDEWRQRYRELEHECGVLSRDYLRAVRPQAAILSPNRNRVRRPQKKRAKKK